jgi:hypothetical protein
VWLYRLLVNACYEEARRHRRWTTHVRVLPMEGLTAPDTLTSIEERDALERRPISPVSAFAAGRRGSRGPSSSRT